MIDTMSTSGWRARGSRAGRFFAAGPRRDTRVAAWAYCVPHITSGVPPAQRNCWGRV